jgi:hypothetical protein
MSIEKVLRGSPKPKDSNANSLKGSISMNIYKSTRAMPYVYMCVHKNTGEFYIGYRSKNVKLNKTSDIDFPTYKTSSKIVRTNFDNFNWIVLAEFFTENAAYDYEQYLINEHWEDPLLINKTCHYNKSRFRHCGGTPCSEETKRKISLSNKTKLAGISKSDEFKEKISKATKGRRHSQETKDKIAAIVSEHHKHKLTQTNKGKTLTDEHKRKISNAKKERDKLRPVSDETRRKISETLRNKKSVFG